MPVAVSQPVITNFQQVRPPELETQPPSPSISSILPQPSETPGSPLRNTFTDSDDSLEILETGSVQAQIDNDPSRRIMDRYRVESSPLPPGPPRGRTKSRRPAILDSDSDDISEVNRPPQGNVKRGFSLSPLRTLIPYKSMVAQDRAASAHPSQNNSPYGSRSSFPFLSTTSLKMSMSNPSFLKFPGIPTATSRNESFVSRKFKGKESTRNNSSEAWEVVEPGSPSTPNGYPAVERGTSSFPVQGENRGSLAPNMPRPVLLESEPYRVAEPDASRNSVGTHPLSLRDRKAPPVPRANNGVRRHAPPPPVQPPPPVLDSVVTPTSLGPVVSNAHSRPINSSPTPKTKKPQVVCASPLGANRWRAEDEVDAPLPSVFHRALVTPLPSTPVEPTHAQLADVSLVIVPPHQAMAFSSNIASTSSQSPLSLLTSLSGATTPPEASPLLPPTPVTRRPSADSDVHSARHYPGRPLPRPPGASRTLIDSTYGHEDFQVNGSTFAEGLLIDFNDTSFTESYPSRASMPQPDEGRHGTLIQISAAPSSSSTSSMEFVESVVSLSSQRDTPNQRPPAARSPAPAQFLDVTDLDVLVSRLLEEQQNGSDYEVSS
jgi:hypothetical protein